jgi:hypothetical protein
VQGRECMPRIMNRTRVLIAAGVSLETCYSYRGSVITFVVMLKSTSTLCIQRIYGERTLYTHSLSPPRGLVTDDTG